MTTENDITVTRRAMVQSTGAALIGATANSAVRASQHERPLRVVQIGLQGHYGFVQQGLKSARGCEFVAAARSMPDEPIEKLKTSGGEGGIALFDDYHEMIMQVKPDIVATFAPYGLNGRVNLDAAKAGCHVISEKPLAATLEELNELRRVRDEKKLHVTALLPMRETPTFAAARQVVREGRIGEPVLISAQKSYRWGKKRPDFYKKRDTFGGSILWVAIHAIDFIRSVSGLEYRDVTARQAVKVHTDYPECEDCGALLFTMSNGGQATLTFDFLRPAKAASHGDDRLRIGGSKGVVEVRASDESWCEVVTNDEAAQRIEGVETGVSVFHDFVWTIRDGGYYYLTKEDQFIATEAAICEKMTSQK